MAQFPILFAWREVVEGDGYFAGVDVRGRALMTQETETEFWLEGVNPGGLSARGATSAEALAEFQVAFRTILSDIAADSPSFDDFRREVKAFFEQVSPTLLAEWEAAVEEVRAGRISAQWMPNQKPLSSSSLGITVEQITHPRAKNFQPSKIAMAV
jgi:hypothetical protein